MVTSMNGLTALQRQVLETFFAREQGFDLSGDAALIGDHLHHRSTTDLDLFTAEKDAFSRARSRLEEVAALLGAVMVIRQQSPHFLRVVMQTSTEGLVVNCVLDQLPPAIREKESHGRVRVDPAAELLINKLTALVGRQEERDLVDVYCLERSGLRVENALAAAEQKDGGCTPANLAWLLDDFPRPRQGQLPATVSADDLRQWRQELVVRLRRQALPSVPPARS